MAYVLDPQARLDFAFDWTEWLAAGETITAFTTTADTGVTVDSSSQTGGLVTVWLTDGVLGSTARVTCHVTTSAGRADDRSITVRVVDR